MLRAERLPVKTYTVADGLLRDSVYKIRQDSRGFLWFCTLEGISRFDGYAFTNFTTDDGLPDRHVNDLLETKNGTYLIATDAGIAKLNPTGLSGSAENPLFKVYLPDNPNAGRVLVLLQDESGTIWAGTSDGLFRVVENGDRLRFENVNLRETLPSDVFLHIVCLLKDRSGTLWIGASSGLFRLLPNGKVEHYTTAHGLPTVNIAALAEDKDGRIWAGMRIAAIRDGGLCLMVAEPTIDQKIVERNYTAKDGLPSNWVLSLFQASDGKFWVGTTSGLCLWQTGSGNSVCKVYKEKNALCGSENWSIAEDKDGNLWTGTRCGLKKISRFGFTTYTEADGLAQAQVNSIFENRDGELFASVSDRNRPVSRFNGTGFTPVEPNFPPNVDYFGWGSKHTVWQDSLGDWWFPTGQGLYRFPKTAKFQDLANTAPRKVETGTNNSEIFRIFEDSRGDIWIATTQPNELLRWDRSADIWHNYTQEAGFSMNRLGAAFAEDRFGNLWIATGEEDSALLRYRDGHFKVFTHAAGAPTDWTRDLFLDHAGRLWLANTTVGLMRLDDTNGDSLQFTKYTTAEGLSSNSLYCVTEDEFGRIYVGSARGLDRLDPETGQVENFTTADGLPDSDIQLAYRGRNNALWFATLNGLARFIPEPGRARMPPTILITGLRVAGLVRPISILGETEIPNIDLASDERQVALDFVGLGANLGEKMRYEYRLAGEDWTQTNERTLNFANLAPGDYRFEVRAVTADRIYSQTPASLSFRIAAPFWQRWWFAASVLLLLSFAGYALYSYRLNKMLEIERTRTRIASDLHDDIGSNLSKISLLSEIVDLQLAKDSTEGNRLLGSIGEIARESVDSMSDIVWAISPRRDSLQELTRRMRSHAEEIFIEKGVPVVFTAPENVAQTRLSMNVRRELYLIFKEAVNNAAKHSGCRRLEIDFQLARREIFLQISDDGRGFDASQDFEGNGLTNMRARAEASGGTFEVESGADRGTTIKIHFPQS